MKKISEHLGQIIVALAAIALLVSVLSMFSAPVSAFFGSVTDTLVEKGADMLDGIGTPVAGENGSGSGATPCCATPSLETYGDDTKCSNCGNVVYGSEEDKGLIPEGAVYYNNFQFGDTSWLDPDSGTVYNAGEEFPELMIGDIYEFGDYKYCYGYAWCFNCNYTFVGHCDDGCNEETEGWNAVHLGSNENPNDCLTSINGQNVNIDSICWSDGNPGGDCGYYE